MGKKIIVRGADFSTNGIPVEVSFNDLVPCVVGKGYVVSGTYFNSSTNTARVSNDITKFADVGLTSFTITPKSGYKIAAVAADNIVTGNMGTTFCDAWVASYDTNAKTLRSADGNSFVIMVAPTDSSVTALSSDDWNTYMTVVMP